MEKISATFPQVGKFFTVFSTLWKNFWQFFHSMENIGLNFPRYGKSGSCRTTPW